MCVTRERLSGGDSAVTRGASTATRCRVFWEIALGFPPGIYVDFALKLILVCTNTNFQGAH